MQKSIDNAFESAKEVALSHRLTQHGAHLGCTVLVNGQPTITKPNTPDYHAEVNAWIISRAKAFSHYCGEKRYSRKGTSAH